MSDLWEHIDLCSGIGGFSLGFQLAELSEPILFCELDEFCQKVLKKHWPNVPICNDVKELADDTTKFIPRTRGRKRILTGGYPCQSFSQAGKRLGWKDPRAIWPFIFRIVQQERPDVCVFENVAGHISLGLDEVLHDLESEGYTTRTFVLPAEACGAPHRRDRLWIIAKNLADTNSKGLEGSIRTGLQRGSNGSSNESADVSNANSIGRDEERNEDGNTQEDRNQKTEAREYQRGSGYVADTDDTGNRASQHEVNQNRQTNDQRRQEQPQPKSSRQSSNVAEHGQPKEGRQAAQQRLGRGILDGLSAWMDEPLDIPRVASGQKNRTHRLKALGNAIVPQIAQRIGIAIRESF